MSLGHSPIGSAPLAGSLPASGGGHSFSLSPASAIPVAGTLSITATGSGTTWGGANPFTIISGPASGISNYANGSATSATFDLTITGAAGTVVISDDGGTTTRNFSVAATVPGAPTIGVATPGNAQASVAFSAPASDGGSAITGYTVTSTPGGLTASGAGSPLVVTGLTNGTAYTFTVHATNAVGNSAESAASSAVTPSTVPSAPTIGTASSGDGSALVTFTPGSDGGSAITGYTVTSSPGGLTGTGSASPITVPGLTNGVAYTFTVHATNANGDSAESASSNSATPNPTVSFLAEVTWQIGVTPGTVQWKAQHIVAGALVDATDWSSTGVGSTPSMTVGASQPAGHTIAGSVTPNNADGSFAGILLVRHDSTSPVYDVQELNTQAKSRGNSRRITKIAPTLTTDVFTVIGCRAYQNVAGTPTALEARTTSGIIAIPERGAAYCRDITVPLAGTEFLGFVLWDLDATTYMQDAVRVPRAANVTAGTSRTVTVTLTADGTTPFASLSGLKWAWWDSATPDLMGMPSDQGAVETTDASGVLSITVNSTLGAGATGWLVVTDSDGTADQDPPHKAFSGPVALA